MIQRRYKTFGSWLIVVSVSAGRDALRVTDDSRCVGAQPS